MTIFASTKAVTRQRVTQQSRWQAMTPAEQRTALLDELQAHGRTLSGANLSDLSPDERKAASRYVQIIEKLEKEHAYYISRSGAPQLRAALTNQ